MRGRQVIIIWSTDWIKDAKTEGEKLLSAVRKAISKYKADGVQTVSVSSNQK